MGSKIKKRGVKEGLQRLQENELAAHGTEQNEMVQVFPGLTESHYTPARAYSSSNGFDISKQI